MKLKVIGEERVGKIKFTGIEGGFGPDKKSMTVKDIANIHGTTVKRVNELINRNRNQFIDGVDVIDLKSNQNFKVVLNDLNFSTKTISNSNHIYLCSERGYLKLLKIMDDDKAWDIYNDIVDNYFNMRVAIKENKPSLVQQERLKIMKDNAATRKANLLFKIAMESGSESSKQMMLARAAKELTGEMVLPVMQEKYYSATEVGKKIGLNRTQVGTIANRIGIKAEQPGQNKYGRWANSKSPYSDKEIPQWLYTKAGMKEIEKQKE